jgi:hypothetical protein
MRVFIWKSFGDIDVCAAETPEQLLILFTEICNSVEYWELDDKIIQLHTTIEKTNNDSTVIIRAINSLLDEIDVGSHESFELGTRFATVRNL